MNRTQAIILTLLFMPFLLALGQKPGEEDIVLFTGGKRHKYIMKHVTTIEAPDSKRIVVSVEMKLNIRGTADSLKVNVLEAKHTITEDGQIKSSSSRKYSDPEDIVIMRNKMRLTGFRPDDYPEDETKSMLVSEITGVIPFSMPPDQKTWESLVPVQTCFFRCSNHLAMNGDIGIIETAGKYRYKSNLERITLGKLNYKAVTVVNIKSKTIIRCNYVYSGETTDERETVKVTLEKR